MKMTMQGFFQVVKATIMPTPGAMEYSMSDYILAHKPWIGPGIAPNFLFRSFATQNYQQQAVAALTGLGGVAHGQNVLQPLSNPYAGS